jgi:hypothetical protein
MIHKTTCKIILALLVALAGILTAGAQVLRAQDDTGAISGTVFRDINGNGQCTNEDEPTVSGIALQLVNRDDNTIVNLTSGAGGFYELVNASLGTWQVTVNPGAGWRVTSPQTRQVLISENEPDVEEVDFCIVQDTAATATTTATATPAPPSTSTPTPSQPVLPESGAPVAPGLLLAGGAGLLFLFAGAILFAYTRRGEDK